MRKIFFRLFCALCFCASLPLFAQEGTLQANELVVVVQVSAKIDTMTETKLRHALYGKDPRFDLVGLQEQYYGALLKQMLKTNSGNFEREWLGLLGRGKKKRRPIVSKTVLELVSLVSKNKNAIAVLEWREIKKAPAEYALKVVSRYRIKP